MNKPKISLIAGIQKKDRAIGNGTELLWHISDDLKRFKALTSGHPIIMGRKTFASIGKALPNRTNIIVTRDHNLKIENCLIVYSLNDALERAREIEEKEVFVIGGGEIYKEAINVANKLYLTVIEGEKEGTVFFPDYSDFKKMIFQEEHLEGIPPYSFIELER